MMIDKAAIRAERCMEIKVCAKCRIGKEITAYHKQRGGKYGVRSVCKDCNEQYRKVYQQKPEVKERNRLQAAKWRESNPELFRQRYRESYERHKERWNLIRRELYKNDPEYRQKKIDHEKKYKASGRRNEVNRLNPKSRERAKKYRINNPDKVRIKQRQYRERIWNEHEKEQRQKLEDVYLVRIIKKQTKYALKTQDIPKELIDIKRQSMKLKREIKSK